jgi:hypothetical protein
MQWKILHSKIPPKLQKVVEIREKEQRKSTNNSKFLQDLDVGGFSHKKRDLISEDVDPDHIYLFSQMDARIIGEECSNKINNGVKNEL